MADVGQIRRDASKRRPDKNDPETVGDSTWLVHGGNAEDPKTGTLRTPIYMANSYALPDDPSNMDWSSPELLIYARNGHVNQ